MLLSSLNKNSAYKFAHDQPSSERDATADMPHTHLSGGIAEIARSKMFMHSFSFELGLEAGPCSAVLDSSCTSEQITSRSNVPKCSANEILPPPSKFPASCPRRICHVSGAVDTEAVPATCPATIEDAEELAVMFSCPYISAVGNEVSDVCSQGLSEHTIKVLFRREYNKAVGLENEQERQRQLKYRSCLRTEEPPPQEPPAHDERFRTRD